MHDMHDRRPRLNELDLNLLVLFDVLVEERQITRTAARLGLSQSATSHALARLRDAVGDPLVTRGSGGLLLTPRAEAMAPIVRRTLRELEHAIRDPVEFDPASSIRSIRVAAADGLDILLMPQLIERLRQDAPGIDLSIVRPPVRELGGTLESGEFDLYYGVLPSRPAFAGLLPDPGVERLETATVYKETWTCVVRRGHPRIRGRLTLPRYASEGHVVYSPTGGGPGVVDRLLEAQNKSRRVVLRVSSFHTAIEAVAQTDLIWTGPGRLARRLDPDGRLLHLRPPLDLPDYAVQIVWHERLDAERYHRWFRRLLLELGGRNPQ